MDSFRIEWHPPLDRIMGKVSLVEATAPIALATVFERLRADEPELARFLRPTPDGTRVRGLLVMRGAETLAMTDSVRPGDRIEVLAGIQGG